MLATEVSTVILTGCLGRRTAGRAGLPAAGLAGGAVLTGACCGGLVFVPATLLDSLDVSLARAAAAAAARDADRADIALGSWLRVGGRLRWEQRSFTLVMERRCVCAAEPSSVPRV